VDAVEVEVTACSEYGNLETVVALLDNDRLVVPNAPHQRSAVVYALAAVDVEAVPLCQMPIFPLYRRFLNIIGFPEDIVSETYTFPIT
jgi:hypothetical protein